MAKGKEEMSLTQDIIPYTPNMILGTLHTAFAVEYLEEIAEILHLDSEKLYPLQQYCSLNQIIDLCQTLKRFKQQAIDETAAELESRGVSNSENLREVLENRYEFLNPYAPQEAVVKGRSIPIQQRAFINSLYSTQRRGYHLTRPSKNCNSISRDDTITGAESKLASKIREKIYTNLASFDELNRLGLACNQVVLMCVVSREVPRKLIKKLLLIALKINPSSFLSDGTSADYLRLATAFEDEEINPIIDFLLLNKEYFIRLFTVNYSVTFESQNFMKFSLMFPKYQAALLSAYCMYDMLNNIRHFPLMPSDTNLQKDARKFLYFLLNMSGHLLDNINVYSHKPNWEVLIIFHKNLFLLENYSPLLCNFVSPKAASPFYSLNLVTFLLINGLSKLLIDSHPIFNRIKQMDKTGELALRLEDFVSSLYTNIENGALKELLEQATNEIQAQLSVENFRPIEESLDDLKGSSLEKIKAGLSNMRNELFTSITLEQRCRNSILKNKHRFKFAGEAAISSESDHGCSSTSPTVDPRFNLSTLSHDMQELLARDYGVNLESQMINDSKSKGPAI